MSEDLSFTGGARLPSDEPLEAEILAQDNNYSNQYGAHPQVSESFSPLSNADVPQPSIEIDNMESNKHESIFVTPEPDDGHSRPSILIPIHSTPDFEYCPEFHKDVLNGDCMIVEETDCSLESRQLWSISKSKPIVSSGRDFGDAVINAESGFEPPRVTNFGEIQRRLMAQHNASRVHKSGSSTIFGPRMARQISLSQSPKRKSKHRRGSMYQQKSLDDIVDVKVEFETLMRRGDENTNWMEEQDDINEEDEEFENLKRLKQAFQRRLNEGGLTEVETIEMMRVNQKIELRNRRQETANRLNLKEVVLVSSDDEGGDDRGERLLRQSWYNQVDEDDQMAQTTESNLFQETREPAKPSKTKGNKKPTKGKGRTYAKTAREVEEKRREREREKERKKRARAALSKRAPPKGKGSRKPGKGAAKKNYKSHMKSAWGSGAEALHALLQDLVHNNFIADRLAQGELPDAPQVNETRKDKALQALLVSAPNDYDTHRARYDKSDLNRASKRFGFGRVKWLVDGSWKLKGMRSPLYHHQLLGADWMLSRELGEVGPFGGLLADAMGFGKTLQTLATMVGNPPSKEDIKAGRKATLIVLPASAIRQWIDEIEVHVDKGLFPKIIHYKASKELPIIFLQDCDIVLTSYSEVMASFPFPSDEDREKYAGKGGYNKWLESAKDIAGDLHKMTWYRIVLDEAHAIKNFKSRTSLACQNLLGKYRWALSGTPIQNRLDELFPYLRFLRAKWTRDYHEFKMQFCDSEADDANARVDVILSIVMRRTMKDKMFGRPIVELPPIHPDTQYITFSREEKTLYRILENRFRDMVNQHLAQGTAERNYTMWMVKILRLRQCTSHPFLLETTVKEIFNLEDISELKAEWKRLSRYKQPMYEQISQWVQQTEEERLAARARGDPTLAPGEIQPFGRSEFGKYFRMENLLDSMSSKDLVRRVICKICGDLPQDALITNCRHIFCRHCLESHQQGEELRNGDTEYKVCPEPCRKIYEKAVPYAELNLPDGEVNTEDSDNAGPRKTKRKRGKRGAEDDLPSDCTWLATSMNNNPPYLPPSSKTVALKAKLLHWINEAPNDKILIFTQWKVMIKIIGWICRMEEWGFCEFTGEMTLDQRHATVKRFHANPSIKIMIASLKCGGQALNLTCANRVVSIDLWWNHSIEQQAFGRVYRIGQHKDTYVTRLVVKNTIDQRMLSMQADKIKTIDRALQDTDAPTMEPLSVADLASLFGHLREQDDGTLRVEPDYEQEDEDEDDSSQGSEPEQEPQAQQY